MELYKNLVDLLLLCQTPISMEIRHTVTFSYQSGPGHDQVAMEMNDIKWAAIDLCDPKMNGNEMHDLAETIMVTKCFYDPVSGLKVTCLGCHGDVPEYYGIYDLYSSLLLWRGF